MRKHIIIFIGILVLCSCENRLSFKENLVETVLTKTEINTSFLKDISSPVTFLADTNFTAWTQIKGLANRMKACEVSNDVLRRMTTDAIVQSVIHYPLNYTIMFYDNPLDGVNLFSQNSSLHKELLNRTDAGDILVSYFSRASIDKDKQQHVNDHDYNNLSFADHFFLEYYLQSEHVIPLYSENNRDSLIRVLPRKIKQRQADKDLNCAPILKPLMGLAELLEISDTLTTRSESSLNQSISTVYTTFKKPLVCYENEEFTDYIIDWYYTTTTSEYPDAIFHSAASNLYNCHSYAWHKYLTSRKVWIESVNPNTGSFQLNKYWTDDLYVETPSSTGAEIVYYDTTPTNYDHSAVLLPNGNFISKWGPGPVMEHEWDDVPHEYLDYLVSLRYFGVRNTPLTNVYTFYGDSFVTPSTNHDYSVAPFLGVDNTWTAEYMVDNTITPFSFFYLHNNNGGTYRFSASSYGPYKLIVEGYYQGHFVSRGEKIVTCVGY